MYIEDHQVINCLLDTPVTLRVREVLATSKELSDQLTDMLKRRNPKPAISLLTVHPEKHDVNAHAYHIGSQLNRIEVPTRGKLLELRIQCNDKPITAIIDTGSELNIVSKEVWKHVIDLPMNIEETPTMNDANGGAGRLHGLIKKVPLSCGDVETTSHLFVADKPPFDLLLGRPWQQSNLIRIYERNQQ